MKYVSQAHAREKGKREHYSMTPSHISALRLKFPVMNLDPVITKKAFEIRAVHFLNHVVDIVHHEDVLQWIISCTF